MQRSHGRHALAQTLCVLDGDSLPVFAVRRRWVRCRRRGESEQRRSSHGRLGRRRRRHVAHRGPSHGRRRRHLGRRRRRLVVARSSVRRGGNGGGRSATAVGVETDEGREASVAALQQTENVVELPTVILERPYRRTLRTRSRENERTVSEGTTRRPGIEQRWSTLTASPKPDAMCEYAQSSHMSVPNATLAHPSDFISLQSMQDKLPSSDFSIMSRL